MNSRERVLAAIEHREPDKVPVDLGAMRSTGIMAIAYHRLRKHLGWQRSTVKVYDVIQQLAQPEDDILAYWGSDAVDLGRAFLTEASDWKDWTLPDGTPAKIPACIDLKQQEGGWVFEVADGTVIGKMPKGVQYLSQCCWPMKDFEEPWDLDRVPDAMAKVIWAAIPTAPYHQPLTRERLDEIRRKAKHLYATTDKAIMVAFGGNFLEWGQFLRRIDNFLMDIAACPKQVEQLLDKLLEVHLANVAKVLPAIRDYVQIIQLGDDLGSQQGAQISPATYRQLFKPRLKQLIAAIKRQCDIKIFLHSCGSVEELIPDLIDAGVEILNPVQTNCARMHPERLKREYGRDICFWGGGCDTQGVLQHGTPEQVRQQVRERMDIFGPGGGFIFTQIHNVLANVPPENVVAMVEAVKEYR